MSEPAKKIEIMNRPLPNMKTRIEGKIKFIDKKQGKQGDYFITTILVPAPTTEDYPTQYPIFSNSKLGNVEQVVDVVLRVQARRNASGFLNVSLAFDDDDR
jgi:hypothetical protein